MTFRLLGISDREGRMLLRTEVGSHMWRMNRPNSDDDYFEVYLGSTRHILLGGSFRLTQGRDELGRLDWSCHELGVMVEQLIKGNINFIIGVNSPTDGNATTSPQKGDADYDCAR